jgi:L-lactate utilization protein LutB
MAASAGASSGGRLTRWSTALKACIELRSQLIEDVYQITGVAPTFCAAPATRARRSAAQGLKAQWGSVRIRDKQKEVARFARDILRIKAR